MLFVCNKFRFSGDEAQVILCQRVELSKDITLRICMNGFVARNNAKHCIIMDFDEHWKFQMNIKRFCSLSALKKDIFQDKHLNAIFGCNRENFFCRILRTNKTIKHVTCLLVFKTRKCYNHRQPFCREEHYHTRTYAHTH